MNTSLRDKVLAEEALRVPNFVTPFHYQWLELRESERIYSEAAIEHMVAWARGDYKKPRHGRFSPSALGRCQRQQMFKYAGADELPPEPEDLDLMQRGTLDHLSWQIEGMSFPFEAPYMAEPEVFVLDRALRFGGSLDGILSDGSGFELKTAHGMVYKKIKEAEAPKFEHRMQREGYRFLTAIDTWTLLYQTRDTGVTMEFRTHGEDAEAADGAMQELEELNDYVDADEMPPILPDCMHKAGRTYKQCGFRHICLRARNKSITEVTPETKEEA